MPRLYRVLKAKHLPVWDRATAVCLITGETGTGKSVTAACLFVTRVLNEGMIGEWVAVSDLVSQARAVYGEDEGSERALVRRYARRELLVLDGLGDERATEYSANLVQQLVASRYENMRATLITTRLDVNRLAARYGEHTVMRLMASAVVVNLSEINVERS